MSVARAHCVSSVNTAMNRQQQGTADLPNSEIATDLQRPFGVDRVPFLKSLMTCESSGFGSIASYSL